MPDVTEESSETNSRLDAARPVSISAAASTAESIAPPAEVQRADWIARNSGNLIQSVMTVLLVVGVLVLCIGSPTFRSGSNLLNILTASSVTGILAVGMLTTIITGGFDLSVGAVGAASGCIAAAISIQQGIPTAIVVALIFSLVVGMTSGLLIGVVDINPFVTTLAVGSVVSGVLYILTDAVPVDGAPVGWLNLGFAKVLGIPMPVVLWVLTTAAVWWLLRRTRFGVYVYSTGSSATATVRAGISTSWILVVVYGICGFCAGLAGVLSVGLSRTGVPTSGATWALTSIAAVVLGGTALRGGAGLVRSAVVGTLLLGVMTNAFTIFGLSPFLVPAVTGAVILLAVGFDSLARKKAS